MILKIEEHAKQIYIDLYNKQHKAKVKKAVNKECLTEDLFIGIFKLTFDSSDLLKLIINRFECYRYSTSSTKYKTADHQLFFKYEGDLINAQDFLDQLITSITNQPIKIQETKYQVEVNKYDVSYLIKDVYRKILNDVSLTTWLKPLDVTKYIAFENKTVDIETNEVVETEEYPLSRLPYNYLTDDEFYDDKYDFYDQVINRILNDWSDNDLNGKKLTLGQIFRAAIEGNGRQSIMTLIGNGGNGKSTILKICEKLVGKKNVAYLALEDMSQKYALSVVNSNTRLIMSGEASSFVKIDGKSWKIAKSLSTQDPIYTDEKYQPYRVVLTSSLILQATNTEISIPEVNEATLRRFHRFEFPNKNFKKSSDFDLDELINKHDFIEYFANWIIRNFKPFKEFYVSVDNAEKTIESIKESQTTYRFIKDYEDVIKLMPIIPTNVFYKLFEYWHNQNQRSMKLKSQKAFTLEIEKYMKDLNFEFDLTKKRFNPAAREQEVSTIFSKYVKSQYQINVDSIRSSYFKNTSTENVIQYTDIADTRNLLLDNQLTSDNLTTLREICLHHLAASNSTAAIQFLLEN